MTRWRAGRGPAWLVVLALACAALVAVVAIQLAESSSAEKRMEASGVSEPQSDDPAVPVSTSSQWDSPMGGDDSVVDDGPERPDRTPEALPEQNRAPGMSFGQSELMGSLVETIGNGELTQRRSQLSLLDEARAALEGYRDLGTCVLVRSGYLDFLGRTWSCTVFGGSWVEVCVIGEREDGTSEVSCVRMDARDWKEQIAKEVGMHEGGDVE